MSAQLVSHLLEEPTPSPFDFEATVRSHGWAALQPFVWYSSTAELCRVHRLDSGKVVRLRVQDGNDSPTSALQVNVETGKPLALSEETEVRRAVRRMFRLDEDLSVFYDTSQRLDGWALSLQPGSGRLLRCPRLFEDIICTLCTTNIAWSGTIRMVDRLVTRLGEPLPGQDEWRAFPTAEAIATAGSEFLRRETGLGYRSDYVWQLADAVAEGRLDLQTFEDPEHASQTLHQALCRIKGIGNYAAATILMILGRYEHLAIDSEMRAFVSEKYFEGESVSDAQIKEIYAPWGRWQYLAYWFDSGGEVLP